MIRSSIAMLVVLVGVGCASVPLPVGGQGSQLEVRQIQTRNYSSRDKALVMRAVIATLQDLGFLIDNSDEELGVITATRLHKYAMRMTVTVRNREPETVSVRLNARIEEDTVDDPQTYQDFFTVLDKSLFLANNKVD